MSVTAPKVKFVKKGVRKNFRKPLDDNLEDEETDISDKILEARELQKLRERPHGVDTICLATGTKISPAILIDTTDPLIAMESLADETNSAQKPKRPETGTTATTTAAASSAASNPTEPISQAQQPNNDLEIGTQFSAETNLRDIDEEMQKFVDEELKKRLGYNRPQNQDQSSIVEAAEAAEAAVNERRTKIYNADEAALSSLPSYLKDPSSDNRKFEEMLSNQILNGIPEVDLGIEAKIRNIEATEKAKRKMFEERQKRMRSASETRSDEASVPSNMAVNFLEIRKKQRLAANPNESDTRNTSRFRDKASDKYVYDKYRKTHR